MTDENEQITWYTRRTVEATPCPTCGADCHHIFEREDGGFKGCGRCFRGDVVEGKKKVREAAS